MNKVIDAIMNRCYTVGMQGNTLHIPDFETDTDLIVEEGEITIRIDQWHAARITYHRATEYGIAYLDTEELIDTELGEVVTDPVHLHTVRGRYIDALERAWDAVEHPKEY